MTIHSSQGSEFEHAMVVLPSQISKVVSRELIYTGVTRAAKRMTMVGSKVVLSTPDDKAAARIRSEEDFVGSGIKKRQLLNFKS